MKGLRILWGTLGAAVALAGTVGGAAAFGRHGIEASLTAPPRAHVRPIVCRRALDPAARKVLVVAVMRPVSDTVAMAIRFDLLERPQGETAFSSLKVGDLGTWISPRQPTLGQRARDVWIVSKPVLGLPAPAAYRFRVAFRWTGASGRILQSTTIETASCTQPELRPDLRLDAVTIAPVSGHPRQAQYTVVTENLGATAAGPFELTLTPADGIGAHAHTVQRLGPHAHRTDVFIGRACSASAAPLVVADPGHLVADYDTSDNELQVAPGCPVTTSQ